MSPEIVTIIGMTATILIVTWTMNRSLRVELRTEIRDIRSEITELRNELKQAILACVMLRTISTNAWLAEGWLPDSGSP